MVNINHANIFSVSQIYINTLVNFYDINLHSHPVLSNFTNA